MHRKKKFRFDGPDQPSAFPQSNPMSQAANYFFIARRILAEQILMGGRLEKTAAG